MKICLLLKFIIVFLLGSFTICCQSQSKQTNPSSSGPIGGKCEGCEALLEHGNKILTTSDTLAYFTENSPKILLKGSVFLPDGKTPAENVIIYIYHTNRNGIYETLGTEQGWGRRHGIYRGWAKTDKNGYYEFYTFRPAAYPNGLEAEHIHMIIQDQTKTPYYIDDILFSDDQKLTETKISRLKNRGGSGLVSLAFEDGLLVAKRDIILGLNIPNYPE